MNLLGKISKKKIGLIAAAILLVVVAGIAVKLILPLSGDKEEAVEVDYSVFVTVEDMQVDLTDASYSATAKVTVPDMSKYIEEFGESGIIKEMEWEKAEKKVAGAFYQFLEDQKELVTVTYELEVDLVPHWEEYMTGFEYLSTREEGADTLFTEEQVQDILMKQAFRMSLETLINE